MLSNHDVSGSGLGSWLEVSGPVLTELKGQQEVKRSDSNHCVTCVSVTVGESGAQEQHQGWNVSQSWEVRMTSEILLGTETSKMRPVGAVGAGWGKAKAEDEKKLVLGTELKDKSSSWECELQGGER